MIDQLNEVFGIHDHLRFETGKGGFVHVLIKNSQGEARISTYAAQVLSYRPANCREDLFFVSEHATYSQGNAIRGGVPICWPWFGPDPEEKGRSAHGFARNSQWRVIGTTAFGDGETLLVLGLESDAATRAIWPYDFELHMEVRVGSSLEIVLTTSNKTTHAMALTQAVHTYFNVGDVRQVEVHGLDAHAYFDKADSGELVIQKGPVTINREVDRIYKDVETDLVLNDPVFGRVIRISSVGSHSAVVWNPWIEKSATMSDLGDNEYLQMLCIETTNAGQDIVTIAPKDSYRLAVRYSAEMR